MYATARDLLNYDRALARHTLLPASVESLMVTRRFELRPGSAYGYGWIIRQQPDSTMMLTHSGGTNGYMTDFARFMRDGLCVIVLSNLGFVDTDVIRKEIVAIVRTE